MDQSSASNPGGAANTKRYRAAPAKTFQCKGFGDCRMVFSRSEHLARHVRKHTGERPFSCHCGKHFSRLDNLRQHAQTVHADKQDENDQMMKELTTLHTTMAATASKGREKRPRGSGAAVVKDEDGISPEHHQHHHQQDFRPGQPFLGPGPSFLPPTAGGHSFRPSSQSFQSHHNQYEPSGPPFHHPPGQFFHDSFERLPSLAAAVPADPRPATAPAMGLVPGHGHGHHSHGGHGQHSGHHNHNVAHHQQQHDEHMDSPFSWHPPSIPNNPSHSHPPSFSFRPGSSGRPSSSSLTAQQSGAALLRPLSSGFTFTHSGSNNPFQQSQQQRPQTSGDHRLPAFAFGERERQASGGADFRFNIDSKPSTSRKRPYESGDDDYGSQSRPTSSRRIDDGSYDGQRPPSRRFDTDDSRPPSRRLSVMELLNSSTSPTTIAPPVDEYAQPPPPTAASESRPSTATGLLGRYGSSNARRASASPSSQPVFSSPFAYAPPSTASSSVAPPSPEHSARRSPSSSLSPQPFAYRVPSVSPNQSLSEQLSYARGDHGPRVGIHPFGGGAKTYRDHSVPGSDPTGDFGDSAPTPTSTGPHTSYARGLLPEWGGGVGGGVGGSSYGRNGSISPAASSSAASYHERSFGPDPSSTAAAAAHSPSATLFAASPSPSDGPDSPNILLASPPPSSHPTSHVQSPFQSPSLAATHRASAAASPLLSPSAGTQSPSVSSTDTARGHATRGGGVGASGGVGVQSGHHDAHHAQQQQLQQQSQFGGTGGSSHQAGAGSGNYSGGTHGGSERGGGGSGYPGRSNHAYGAGGGGSGSSANGSSFGYAPSSGFGANGSSGSSGSEHGRGGFGGDDRNVTASTVRV